MSKIDPLTGNALLGAGTSILGSIMQMSQLRRANDIEQGNVKMARENLAYQRNLQRELFGREDTSVQRRIQDLKEAGLHPMLAAGQGARAGEVIKTSAPSRQTESHLMKSQALGEMVSRVADVSKTFAETQLLKATRDRMQSETAFTEGPKTDLTYGQLGQVTQNIRKLINENQYLEKTIDKRVDKIRYETELAHLNRQIADYKNSMTSIDYSLYKHYHDSLMAIAQEHGAPKGHIMREDNPHIQALWKAQEELVGLEIYNELKKWDKDYFVKAGLPSSNQPKADGILAGRYLEMEEWLMEASQKLKDFFKGRRRR